MISVITPTADQPTGMALLEGYVGRQTVQPDQWIVADDGTEPARLTLGQEHIVRERTIGGGASLALNLLAALEAVRGDYVVIMEHDDWYAPDHIETCLNRGAAATGAWRSRYYHVGARRWAVVPCRGASLCNTAFSVELLPAMIQAAEEALRRNIVAVDRLFWGRIRGDIHRIETVVGIKGLPGRKGLGMGHRNFSAWAYDADGSLLREWVGDDAEHYLGGLSAA